MVHQKSLSLRNRANSIKLSLTLVLLAVVAAAILATANARSYATLGAEQGISEFEDSFAGGGVLPVPSEDGHSWAWAS